jgi:DNA-binding protein H-NS
VYAADFGSVEDLRAKKDIHYVALMVGQKYKDHPASTVKSRPEYDKFVKDVKETGELVWTGRPRPPQIVNPHLELYRLPPLEGR